MRKVLMLCPALLAGCATVPAPAPVQASAPVAQTPVAVAATGDCRRDDYAEFIGRTRSPALEAELRTASGARVIRWVEPGMMVTMDYREDRLTVKLDDAKRILSASCG